MNYAFNSNIVLLMVIGMAFNSFDYIFNQLPITLVIGNCSSKRSRKTPHSFFHKIA